MPGLGHASYIGIAKQSAWDTKVVAGLEFVEFTSEGLDVMIEEAVTSGINGSRVPRKRVTKAKRVGGPISWEVNAEDFIGHALLGVLPDETFVDDGAGNGGQHTFVVADTIPAFTIQKGLGGIGCRDLWGGKFGDLSFTIAMNEILMATANLTFYDEEAGTPQDPSHTTEKPLVCHTGTFELDGSEGDIQSATLTISPTMKDQRGRVGSPLIKEQLGGRYAITGNIVAAFEDTSLLTKYLTGAAAKLRFAFTGTMIGTTQRALDITLPVTFFNGELPKTPGIDAEIVQTIPFVAIQDGTGTPDELISILLKNSRRSAY